MKERVDRFQEFTDLLVRLRTEDHVTATGRWFSAADARTLPPLRDVPLIVAGNGPRSVRYAARTGDGWVTTGRSARPVEEWWAGARRGPADPRRGAGVRRPRPGDVPALPAARQRAGVRRGAVLAAERGLFEEMVGRAAELGFTDVISHWPRPSEPYAGRSPCSSRWRPR